MQWAKVSEALSELDVELNFLKAERDDLGKRVATLLVNARRFARLERKVAYSSEEKVEAIERVVWNLADDTNEDEFDNSVLAIVTRFEEKLHRKRA